MPISNFETAIFIHGCHIDSHFQGRNWSGLVWGNNDPNGPPSLFGRAIRGLQVAFEENARLLIFGAGVNVGNGRIEAQHIHEFLTSRTDKLASFFHQKWGIPVSSEDVESRLWSVTLNLISRNTTEECREAVTLCMERGIGRLFGVTNAFHAPRALRELNAAHAEIFKPSLDGNPMQPILSIFAAPALGTLEEIRSTEINEHAHRPKKNTGPAAHNTVPNSAHSPA